MQYQLMNESFLIIYFLNLVIISMIPPLLFTFNTVIKGQFSDVQFSSDDEDPIDFDNIRTVKDFWTVVYDFFLNLREI